MRSILPCLRLAFLKFLLLHRRLADGLFGRGLHITLGRCRLFQQNSLRFSLHYSNLLRFSLRHSSLLQLNRKLCGRRLLHSNDLFHLLHLALDI